jgi:hypothetical protein
MDTSSSRVTATATGLKTQSATWMTGAACRGADAPCMFADRWGIGESARRQRTAALAACRRCPVRRECGLAALADVDAGMSLYGVLCGVEFTDVTPSRQQRDVARLRLVVAALEEDPSGGRPVAVITVSPRQGGKRSLVQSAHS